MASSGYTAITFVANEQPTTAKWNLIGSNDASFNNGNGFEDGIIIGRHLATSAVTTKALKPSIIDFTDPGATNFVVNATTYQNITGVSTTYTSGPTAEKLILFLTGMVTGSGGNYGFFGTLNVNGTDLDGQYLTAPNGLWDIFFGMYIANIPANTTVTIQARGRTQAGGAIAWGRDNADVAYRAKIKGFAVSNV